MGGTLNKKYRENLVRDLCCHTASQFLHQGELFTLYRISWISPRLYIRNELVYVIKKLVNKENCKYTYKVCSVYAEAEFLDVIGTKVLRVFFPHYHLF